MNITRGHSWVAMIISSALVLGLGLVLIQVGARPFGWFAYAPLAETGPLPFLPRPMQTVGLVLLAVGFGSICALTGYRIGRLRSAR